MTPAQPSVDVFRNDVLIKHSKGTLYFIYCEHTETLMAPCTCIATIPLSHSGDLCTIIIPKLSNAVNVDSSGWTRPVVGNVPHLKSNWRLIQYKKASQERCILQFCWALAKFLKKWAIEDGVALRTRAAKSHHKIQWASFGRNSEQTKPCQAGFWHLHGRARTGRAVFTVLTTRGNTPRLYRFVRQIQSTIV